MKRNARRGSLLLGAALALTWIIADEARAQPHPWAKSQESRIGLDFDFWPANQPGGALTRDVWTLLHGWDVHAQIRIVEHAYLAFEVPWALGGVLREDPGDDDWQGIFGNPTFGAYYATNFKNNRPGLAFFAGGSLSIPTQLIEDPDLEERFTAAGAIMARGHYDGHRYMPEHVPLRARVGMELRPVDWFYFRSELNPVLHIPIDGDTEFWLDQGNEIEFRHDGGFGGGFRFQQVITPTGQVTIPFWLGDGDDSIQFAMEPFIGYEAPKPAFFFRLGYLWALDEALGFAFDHRKVATIRTTFGGKW